ncbi:MAG: M23 family metallopeptidase [Cyanobacteria bacterium J06634_5]
MLFTTPIGGTAYKDWTIANYVDRDPSSGISDYRGGNISYNGHQGIDYTLPHFAAMDSGIPVYAAAPGTVISTHDGEFDRCTPENPCSDANFVVIDHGDGLVTRYWHLRKNSVSVAVGDRIEAGDEIALVGSSGVSSDAHLHFEVSLNGQIIDPYEDINRWWKDPTVYAGDVVGVLDYDIVAHAPSLSELRERPVAEDIFTQTPGQQVFMWTQLHGIDQGDELTFSFFRPDGTLYNQFSWEDVSAFSYGWWVAALGLPDLPQVGQWQVEFENNGKLLATDTFTVTTADEPVITATVLTNTGWTKDLDVQGYWTNKRDSVQDLTDGIEVAVGTTAKTLGGNDAIFGKVVSGNGILNQGKIVTGNGQDSLVGAVEGIGDFNSGIFQVSGSTLNTGEGKDSVTGEVIVKGNGSSNSSIFQEMSCMQTGGGSDDLHGIVSVEGDGNFNSGIFQRTDSNINTGGGKNSILGEVIVKGNGSSNSSIFQEMSRMQTGGGSDDLHGTVSVEGDGNFNSGIFQRTDSNMNTGGGHDTVTGQVIVQENGSNHSSIFQEMSRMQTGGGKDSITGTVTVEGSGENNSGIFQRTHSVINTGNGSDSITGEVQGNGAGIFNDATSLMTMGNGKDYLTGSVTGAGFGINNSGSINMGNHQDVVEGIGADAFYGFIGGGKVFLGAGADRIIGFGEQMVNGGTGIDTAEFEFSLDSSIRLGSSAANALNVIANGVTMAFVNVEKFMFNGDTFLLQELQNTS